MKIVQPGLELLNVQLICSVPSGCFAGSPTVGGASREPGMATVTTLLGAERLPYPSAERTHSCAVMPPPRTWNCRDSPVNHCASGSQFVPAPSIGVPYLISTS